ncbi:OsmC family protein [Pararhizobium antarcticum]|uniref:Peroxiredoxin n=1 Tax=Pararhizobium antarcticum TaxID=1798805 RepID=A0A657LYI7_9HYPH|nr:OsmC family protein [Pararhizobium antarcticum]OJG00118.1 peroxiredoxin [Rhizobium sp. 58]OJG01479.1 peroxiredoxin [Pararhizobium antarcticum]
MAHYTATIVWERGDSEVFTDNRYSRGHSWSFDGGVSIRASSSPHVVPRYSDPAGVDPEEAFVASLSSCHMMSFLYLAAKRGLVVNRYDDTAEGAMEKNASGHFWVSRVTLRPRIAWEGDVPERSVVDALHHQAHEECFIANSVRTEVRCEPHD